MKGGMNMSEHNGNNSIVSRDHKDHRELAETSVSEPLQSEAELETKLGLSMLGKLALSVVVIVSLIISISCLMKFNQLEEEREDLKAELNVYNEAIRELQEIINSPMDDEFIIQQAKDKLGYYFPDENIYHQDVNE